MAVDCARVTSRAGDPVNEQDQPATVRRPGRPTMTVDLGNRVGAQLRFLDRLGAVLAGRAGVEPWPLSHRRSMPSISRPSWQEHLGVRADAVRRHAHVVRTAQHVVAARCPSRWYARAVPPDRRASSSPPRRRRKFLHAVALPAGETARSRISQSGSWHAGGAGRRRSAPAGINCNVLAGRRSSATSMQRRPGRDAAPSRNRWCSVVHVQVEPRIEFMCTVPVFSRPAPSLPGRAAW